jgi:hypothetical protein
MPVLVLNCLANHLRSVFVFACVYVFQAQPAVDISSNSSANRDIHVPEPLSEVKAEPVAQQELFPRHPALASSGRQDEHTPASSAVKRMSLLNSPAPAKVAFEQIDRQFTRSKPFFELFKYLHCLFSPDCHLPSVLVLYLCFLVVP